jgi:homoserine kinase
MTIVAEPSWEGAEALNVCILSRLPWLNESQLDVVIVSPEVQCLTDKSRAIVHANDIRQPAS